MIYIVPILNELRIIYSYSFIIITFFSLLFTLYNNATDRVGIAGVRDAKNVSTSLGGAQWARFMSG